MDTTLPKEDVAIPKWIIYILLGIVGIVIYTFLVTVVFQKLNVGSANGLSSMFLSQNAISGTLDINGMAPANATIALGVRTVGQQQFTIVSSSIAPIDGGAWVFNGAKKGTA